MSYRPISEAEATEQIQALLGYPVVGVEMAPENFTAAFNATCRWFVSRKGQTKRHTIPLVAGIQEYSLPDDCDVVVDVMLPPGRYDVQSQLLDFGLELGGVPVAYTRGNDRSGLGGYSGLVQRLEYNEIARDIFSSSGEWVYDELNRKLVIGGQPAAGALMMVLYKSLLLDLAKTTSIELELFMDYFLAATKVTYGRILRKHTDIPGASGAKNMDGESLVSEGTEAMAALNERIGLLNNPAPFFAE